MKYRNHKLIFSPALLGLTLVASLVAFLVASVAGCDQGEGERCQTDGDCKSGLQCNEGTQLCQGPNSVRDASILQDSAPRPDAPVLPEDAGVMDAGLTDAALQDAMMSDAAPEEEL